MVEAAARMVVELKVMLKIIAHAYLIIAIAVLAGVSAGFLWYDNNGARLWSREVQPIHLTIEAFKANPDQYRGFRAEVVGYLMAANGHIRMYATPSNTSPYLMVYDDFRISENINGYVCGDYTVTGSCDARIRVLIDGVLFVDADDKTDCQIGYAAIYLLPNPIGET